MVNTHTRRVLPSPALCHLQALRGFGVQVDPIRAVRVPPGISSADTACATAPPALRIKGDQQWPVAAICRQPSRSIVSVRRFACHKRGKDIVALCWDKTVAARQLALRVLSTKHLFHQCVASTEGSILMVVGDAGDIKPKRDEWLTLSPFPADHATRRLPDNFRCLPRSPLRAFLTATTPRFPSLTSSQP